MKKLQNILLLILIFIGNINTKTEIIDKDTGKNQLKEKLINVDLKLTIPSLSLARLLNKDALHESTGYTQQEIEEKLSLSKNFLEASLVAKARDYASKDSMLDFQKKRAWFGSVFVVSTFLSGFSYYYVAFENKREYAALAAYSMFSSLIFGVLEMRRNYKKNSLEKELEILKKQECCLNLIFKGASLENIQEYIMKKDRE